MEKFEGITNSQSVDVKIESLTLGSVTSTENALATGWGNNTGQIYEFITQFFYH